MQSEPALVALSVLPKNRLASRHKTAMKITGMKQHESTENPYNQSVMKQAIKISSHLTHPLSSKYELLPSGRRFRMPKCITNRHKWSFVPASTKLLNNVLHSALFLALALDCPTSLYVSVLPLLNAAEVWFYATEQFLWWCFYLVMVFLLCSTVCVSCLWSNEM